MARLVVEDSSLGRFLDELPSLVMQYKQMQYMQEERALDREERKEERSQDMALRLLSLEMKKKAIDLAASKDLYNENQKLYYNALDNLQELESTYGETVGTLEPLNEMYKASGKDVTVDIYQGEANNYQGRAGQALENLQAVRNKIGVIQGSLYGDVKRAKNIMAGGAGFEGGVDTKGWDLSDLGIVAYENRFGESSPTVVAMFENNPGLMTSSLASLQKTEGAIGLTREKREYYKRTGTEKDSNDAMKQSELVFGTLASSAIKTSGKQEYDGLVIQAASFSSDQYVDQVLVNKNKNRQFAITKEIGEEFSELTGQDVPPEDYVDITSDYFEMLSLGRGASAVRQGQTAYGNWSVYSNYISMARDEYVKALKAGNPEKARRLNELAEKYFGKPLKVELTSFAEDMGKYFSDTILSSFGDDILDESLDDENQYPPADSSNINIQDLENIEDQEWEDLLSP